MESSSETPSKYTADYERAKYEAAFAKNPNYGHTGLRFIKEFSKLAATPGPVLDVGAGNGAPAGQLRDLGYKVKVLDIAHNAGCMKVPEVEKFVHCAWEFPYPCSARWIFCTDFMEHVPPERVVDIIKGHAAMAEGVFYNICFVGDSSGPKLVGEPFHLTIRNFEWWKNKLEAVWPSVTQIGKRTTGSSSWWCYEQ